jgi:hypothetical protein
MTKLQGAATGRAERTGYRSLQDFTFNLLPRKERERGVVLPFA